MGAGSGGGFDAQAYPLPALEPIQWPHWLKGESGSLGVVICFDDGGFGVVDFKTSARNSEHIPLYARQLHAYVCALE